MSEPHDEESPQRVGVLQRGFGSLPQQERGLAGAADRMTVDGTVRKTSFLLGVVVVAAVLGWQVLAATPAMVAVLFVGAALGAFALGLAVTLRPARAPALAPLYAAAEGLALGAFTWVGERIRPGVGVLAVAITLTTLAAMLAAYRAGLLRATSGLVRGVTVATAAIALTYVAGLALSAVGLGVPFLHQTGVLGLGLSLVIVGVAALNLIVDFGFVEEGAAEGAPAHFEWYAAFGLLVTLVWIYVEVARLLVEIALALGGDDD